MAIDEIVKGVTATSRSTQPLQGEEKEKNIFKDVLAAPFRGVEGAVQGVYNLADWATGDELLPDYNKRFLGRSNTIAGGLVEGVAQFMTGFVPVAGQLGRVGTFAKLSGKVGSKTALKIARKSKDLSPVELRKLNAVKRLGKSKKEKAVTNIAAGAAADFLVFDAQEERLSNLINTNDTLRNPVTEFLASKGEDEGELEGRFKNVIEGLFLEAGIGGAVGFVKAVKMIKNRNKALGEGKSKEEATEDAIDKSDLTEDEINSSREDADNKHDRDNAEADDTGDDFLPEQIDYDFNELNIKELRYEARRQGLDTKGSKEEILARLNEKMADINTNRGFDTQFKDLTYKQLQEEAKRQGLPANGKKADLQKRLQEKAEGGKPPEGNPPPKPEGDEGSGGKPPEGGEGAPKPDADDGAPDLSQPTVSIFKKLQEGGEQAILSAARSVRNSAETAKLIRAMSLVKVKEMRAEKSIPRTTAAELAKESRDAAEIMGGDVNAWTARISKLAKDGGDLDKVLEEQRAIRKLQEVIGKEIHDVAKQTNEAIEKNVGNVDGLRTDLISLLDQFTEVQRVWGLYGRNLSLGLLQRKFMYKKGHYKRQFGYNAKKSKNAAADQAYRNQARGSMSEKKMLKLLMDSADSNSIEQSLLSLNKISKGSRGRLFFDMTREYWINALLSAPSTQIVNIMGNAITYAMRSAETAVGAALTGNTPLLKSQLNLAFHMESVAEAWKLMWKAVREDEAITIANHRAFDDTSFELGAISGKNANKMLGGNLKDGGLTETAFNWMGTASRMPSRFLLGGDEFFKALSYRQYIRTELSTQGLRQGIKDPKELAKFVELGLEKNLTDGGRAFSEENILRDANKLAEEKGLQFEERETFVNDYMEKHYVKDESIRIDEEGRAINMGDFGDGEQKLELGERGAQYAKINSHTQDSDIASLRTISKLIADNPWMSFVVPFVRTPTNILTFGVSRTFLGFLNKDTLEASTMWKKSYREKMMSSQTTAREKSEMVGRLATATATTSALMWYVSTNQDFITGYGSKKREQRDAEKLGGFQEYSIRIPANTPVLNPNDTDKHVSYQRLDPMATMLGIMADLAEYRKYDESGTDDAVSLVFSNIASTIVNNITNKSYVQGLDNLFNVLRDPTKNGERFLGNIAGGFVPNILNQAQNYEEDRMLRETRGIMDYMIKRTPLVKGSKALGIDPLSPRRNLLGEIETVPSHGLNGVFNPIYSKEIPNSIVEQEMGAMGVGFSKPTELLGGSKNLDMRDFRNEEGGQTAYDRMAELSGTVKINNKTLKQSLEQLMGTSFYQSLPSAVDADKVGEKSPRIKEIQRYLRSFRSLARSEMLREYPQLQQAYYDAQQQKENLVN